MFISPIYHSSYALQMHFQLAANDNNYIRVIKGKISTTHLATGKAVLLQGRSIY